MSQAAFADTALILTPAPSPVEAKSTEAYAFARCIALEKEFPFVALEEMARGCRRFRDHAGGTDVSEPKIHLAVPRDLLQRLFS